MSTKGWAWLFLFIASCFEIAWIYSVKYVSKDKLLHIPWKDFFHSAGPIMTLLPLIGYIVFGICNIYFFSTAMNSIPASTAFAAWTGTALIGSKIVDSLILGVPITFAQIFFLACILVGIVGLRIKGG